MSDNEDDPIENPEPESDLRPEASDDLNTAPEAEADTNRVNSSQEQAVSLDQVQQQEQQQHNDHQETCRSGEGLEEVEENEEQDFASGSNEPEPTACSVDHSLAEGDQNRAGNSDSSETGHYADHMAEGDQHQFAVDGENSGNIYPNGSANINLVVHHHQDEFAAEDEQYLSQSNEVDFSGAEWSLEPEENSQVIRQSGANTSDGAEGAGMEIEEDESDSYHQCSGDASARTESSIQLMNLNPEGCGAEAFDVNAGVESYGVESEISEAEGASAIIGEHLAHSEAEAEQIVASEGPDGQASNVQCTISNPEQVNSVNSSSEILPPIAIVESSPEKDAPSEESNVGSGVEEVIPETSHECSVQNADSNVPEDELSVLDCTESKVVCCSESYQPECDQSSETVSPGDSSPSLSESVEPRPDSGSDVVNNVPGGLENSPENMARPITDSREGRTPPIASAIQNNKDLNCNDNLSDKSHISPNGAIPKNQPAYPTVKQEFNDQTMAVSKPSGTSRTPALAAGVDSEDELLSELDATLTGHVVNSHSLAPSSAGCGISDTELEVSNLELRSSDQTTDQSCDQSCDQCKKNKTVCSYRGNVQKGSDCELRGVKKRLHQTQQTLLDKECDISRLKEELHDVRERLETVCQEKESCQRELECRTHESSSDNYLPQIKELEYTIAQQQSEIRGFKDKLSSHDAAAKRAIAALQQEMKTRVEQLSKRCDEATKEKDMMVVKFAQAEHKNLECLKQGDRLDAKLREMEKERETFLTRVKAIKEQRTKLAAECDAKASEISQLNKELDKHRELVSSGDVRVKWAQNKLKAELEAHKDTKIQLEKMTVKLKEAKEETQQIRQDCQAMIRTYQESEEVKSNSLDKELKLKETELLQNQMQKNNFELAHVKTQRELEQVKKDYDQSRGECRQLQEQIFGLEGERDEMKKSITSYTEIIQRQKKDIQELRERVESLVQYKTDFIGAQELIKALDAEISELKINNKDLVADMDACRRRETEKLEVMEKLSRKNAELQSESTTQSNKVMNLQGELQSMKMEFHDVDTRLKDMADSLAQEKKYRQDETRELNTKLAGKCKAVEDLTRKVDEEKDEIRILKRKHTNNVKDLTRQLQQSRRKLENYETTSNGDKDTVSMGSRTSSNGSLNTISMSDNAGNQVAQPNGGAGGGSMANTHSQRNPSPEQEYPVIVEQVQVDKQVLIERIVKLQRMLAKRNEKVEFMDDHVSQLIDEIQKKNRIIQSYVLKEETGTMTSERRDQTKAEIARKHSIMGSVYSSHSNDGTMTLDLSLEINKKLQAVLEDTLLKNMTLKESLDTLGQEIARLSQENRQLQLRQQQQQQQQQHGKSRSRGNPSAR